MKKQTRRYYFYRNEMIERFGSGWCWVDEMCRGGNSAPVYKTIEDARNAIRKGLDWTHKAEPRVIQTVVWDMDKMDWFLEKEEES